MNKFASASAMQISKRDDSWYVTLISTLLQKNATILYVRSLLPPCPHGALQSNISESPTDRECRCTVRFVPISSKTSKILCEEPDITMKYHDRMVIYIAEQNQKLKLEGNCQTTFKTDDDSLDILLSQVCLDVLVDTPANTHACSVCT